MVLLWSEHPEAFTIAMIIVIIVIIMMMMEIMMMMMYVYHVYASSLWRPKEVTDGMVVTVALEINLKMVVTMISILRTEPGYSGKVTCIPATGIFLK